MAQTSSAIVIDDSEGVRRRVTDVLSAAGLFETIYSATNGIEGFKLLVTQRVDLILCDVNMPGMDGFRFLALKATRPEYALVPVIFLTADGDLRSKVKGFEAGAADYLTKPFDDLELIARVRVHLKLKLLQDELHEKNARLELLSRTDGLTGLTNRRYFNEVFAQEVGRAKRYETPLSLGLVDLDHFKRVNDTHGHLVGDAVLVNMGRLLIDGFRVQDIVSRFGGEEFAVLLPHTAAPGARIAFERFCKQVAAADTVHGDVRLRVTASIGVATMLHPDSNAPTADALIAQADAALYEAKRLGRNNVVMAP